MAESSEDASSSEGDPPGNEELKTKPGGNDNEDGDGSPPDPGDEGVESPAPESGSTQSEAEEKTESETVTPENSENGDGFEPQSDSNITGEVEDGEVERVDPTQSEGVNASGPADMNRAESAEEADFRSEEADPEIDDGVSSIAGRAKPALAERQALVAVAGAMGLGVGGAVFGVLLDMTVRDVKFVLALGGLLLLTMAAFVLFRAMLSAAERNDEPAKTALTHPLFMLLFVVLATATGLFIGLLRMGY